MRFSNPWWLAAGLLACLVLIWMWRRYDARQHAALAKFVSAHLRRQLTRSISVARRRVQRGLYLAALACLFVALAGPLVGYHWEQVSRRGNEIVFAIDTSRSMLTPDVKPNRLTRAKLAIDDFAGPLGRRCGGHRGICGQRFSGMPDHARLWRVSRDAGRNRHQHDSARRHQYLARHSSRRRRRCAAVRAATKY